MNSKIRYRRRYRLRRQQREKKLKAIDLQLCGPKYLVFKGLNDDGWDIYLVAIGEDDKFTVPNGVTQLAEPVFYKNYSDVPKDVRVRNGVGGRDRNFDFPREKLVDVVRTSRGAFWLQAAAPTDVDEYVG